MLPGSCMLPLRVLLAALLLAGAGLHHAAAEPESGRPNILFIFTDDQSHRTLSCYAAEGAWPWVRTPHIDRLAAEGVKFAVAYGGSWCTPSRASTLTGLLPHGIRGVRLAENSQHTNRWANIHGDAYDPAVTRMWPVELRESGYKTAMIGKWHLGQNAGHGRLWDYSVVWDQNTPEGDWYNDQELSTDGGPPQVVPGYSTDVYTRLAADCIRRAEKSPWFLWLCYHAPHSPNTVHPRHADRYENGEVPIPANVFGPRPDKPEYLKTRTHFQREADGSPSYKNQSVPELVRDYNRLVSSLDEGVGELVRALEETGQLERTLIIFTSDQGYAWGEHGFTGKVGPYDACLRMPLIFRLPGKVSAGKACAQPASIVDLPPTILGFAGVPLPWPMHGHDLAPLLREPDVLHERPLLMENFLGSFGEDTNPPETRGRTARGTPWWLFLQQGRYKYIRNLVPSADEELYDLVSDPGELNNLAAEAEMSAVVSQYRQLLDDELARTGAEFAGRLPPGND